MTHHQIKGTLLQRLSKLFGAFHNAADLHTVAHPKGGKLRRDRIVVHALCHLVMKRPHDLAVVRRIPFLWYTCFEFGG